MSGESSSRPSDPSPALKELNRVDILPDGWVHICVGSEKMPNRDEIQCRGSLDKETLITVSFMLLWNGGGLTPIPFTSLAGTGFPTIRLRHANRLKVWDRSRTPIQREVLQVRGSRKDVPGDYNNCDLQMDIVYARAFIAYTDCDIISVSSFDWGTPIMVALYWGLDEVFVLNDGKVKKLITGFYAMLEFWFFEYCRVGMYLVK
ncbi:hypothetical protein GIB67_016076, partial [Kingdonia uniflora]